jgi:hypothetical protein
MCFLNFIIPLTGATPPPKNLAAALAKRKGFCTKYFDLKERWWRGRVTRWNQLRNKMADT